MNKFVLWNVKLTGLPVAYFFYKKKVICENNNKSLRKIKGGALIVSNHTSVYDYPLVMYTFLNRNIRTLVAEIIYEKNPVMARLMKNLGGIRVDRKNYDFSFMNEAINCLKNKEVVLVYPESRIPNDDEKDDLLEFKPSYVYMALESGVPIIPVCTNGIYGKDKKKYKTSAKLIIGNPIYPYELVDSNKEENENIEYINNYVRNYIKELKNKL